MNPPEYSRAGQLLRLAQAAGGPALEWQAKTLLPQLACDPSGVFTHPIAGDIVPRRNGKTHKVFLRMIAGALLWDERKILYTAHLGDTVRETFVEFVTFLESTGFARYIDHRRISWGKGAEAVTFRNGAVVKFRPRTKKIGRGLESDTIVIDEALEVTEEQLGLLTPLRAKAAAQGRGQLWYASSAGHGGSVVLSELAEVARTGSNPRLVLIEYAAPRDADPTLDATILAANPAAGTNLLSLQWLHDQRTSAGMDLETYGREHLGWFTDSAGAPFIPPGQWVACRVDAAPPGPWAGPPILAVEMQRERTAAIVAAAPLPGGRVWVEPLGRIESPYRLEPATLAAEIRGMARDVGANAVVGDDLTTTTILTELTRLGLHTHAAGPTDIRAACAQFLDTVSGGRVLHAYDGPATLEMVGASGAPTGDNQMRISRRLSTTDTVRPVATVLAVWGALNIKPRVARVLSAQ